MNSLRLYKQAVRLFPRTSYLDHAAVRHARRQWLCSVFYLRFHSPRSKWILDHAVARIAAPLPE